MSATASEFVPVVERPAGGSALLASTRAVWLAALSLMLLQAATNSAMAIMAAELGLLLWIAKHSQDQTAAKLLLAFFALFPCFATFSPWYGEWLDRIFPLKYDQVLYAIDLRLGFNPSFWISRPFYHSSFWRAIIGTIYESLDLMMVLWYALHLRKGEPNRLLAAYGLTFGAGCLLYMVLPACGPAFAFPGFPDQAPAVRSGLMRLSGMPNCVPSLHIATAVLFISFRAAGRGSNFAAWFFLAGTWLATLVTGQHYLIDLFLGVPFGWFCAAAARRQWYRSAWTLALTIVPMLAIRMF